MCEQFSKGEEEDAEDESDISCNDTSREIKETNTNEDEKNKKEIDNNKHETREVNEIGMRERDREIYLGSFLKSLLKWRNINELSTNNK